MKVFLYILLFIATLFIVINLIEVVRSFISIARRRKVYDQMKKMMEYGNEIHDWETKFEYLGKLNKILDYSVNQRATYLQKLRAEYVEHIPSLKAQQREDKLKEILP